MATVPFYRSFLYRYRFIGSPFVPPISLPFSLRYRSWLEEATVPISDDRKPTVAVLKNLTVTDSFIRGDEIEILHRSHFFNDAVDWVAEHINPNDRDRISIVQYRKDEI